MAGETQLTIVGNLTGDPELRFLAKGDAVANFTVAATPRTFDRQANEWKDGETLFMRCTAWRDVAEHVAESLTKGMRVIVSGSLNTRSWEDNGQKRSVTEMKVDEVGPSLKYATAQVTRAQAQGGGNQRAAQAQQAAPEAQAGFPAGGADDDPWAATPATDEPPF